MQSRKDIQELLLKIYGNKGSYAFERICSMIDRTKKKSEAGQRGYFSENDTVLITYADSLIKGGQRPLATLHDFATRYFNDCFSAVHLLPFFPYSSDDGFSVIDFFEVNPEVGTWHDIEMLGCDFDLMFDFVLNHISAKSSWFEKYLGGMDGFRDLAIEVSPATDLTAVTRPRALPLLTPYKKSTGQRVHLWTTFSDDQVDLNYNSVEVLCKMVEVLLFYVDNGATMIRMDAVAYLWKEIGTPCIHLWQTHAMVKLFRLILDQVDPSVLIVTETNVPHDENVSYFGNGSDEAQMVYNFSLPPLLLYTFQSQDSRALSSWARTLDTPSRSVTYFNFTASHDGVGVRPLEGILDDAERDKLIQYVTDRGGQVSYKQNPDGTASPYELNITYVDALSPGPHAGAAEHAARFLASQAIQLSLPGVPGVYIHSVLGSRNWYDGMRQTGRNRTINRERLHVERLLTELGDPGSLRGRIFSAYRHMLKVRKRQPAFHPLAECKVLDLHRSVFALRRKSDEQTIYALTHIGGSPVELSVELIRASGNLTELLTGKKLGGANIRLDPHETLWLATSDYRRHGL
jgi:sucrose phosphorylase